MLLRKTEENQQSNPYRKVSSMKRSQKQREGRPIPQQTKYQKQITLNPITSNQSLFMDALRNKQLVVADGSSSTDYSYR